MHYHSTSSKKSLQRKQAKYIIIINLKFEFKIKTVKMENMHHKSSHHIVYVLIICFRQNQLGINHFMLSLHETVSASKFQENANET